MGSGATAPELTYTGLRWTRWIFYSEFYRQRDITS